MPEDLLPDFDLKIMPGRGIMCPPPQLAPSTHANSTYCSNHGCGNHLDDGCGGVRYCLGWIFVQNKRNLEAKKKREKLDLVLTFGAQDSI